MQENNLNDVVNRMKSFSDSVHKAAENMEKSAKTEEEKAAAEEVKESAAVKLYNAITDATVDILRQPTVVKIFDEFGSKIGKDFSSKLVELVAITMSHSAVHAIIAYDGLLKHDLEEHDKQIFEALNILLADDKGHDMAIKEIRDRISEMQKKLE